MRHGVNRGGHSVQLSVENGIAQTDKPRDGIAAVSRVEDGTVFTDNHCKVFNSSSFDILQLLTKVCKL